MLVTTSPLDVKARLELLLPAHCGTITDTTQLAELALDSMDAVEFLCAVHEEFGVRLSDSDFSPSQTIAGLATLITDYSRPQ